MAKDSSPSSPPPSPPRKGGEGEAAEKHAKPPKSEKPKKDGKAGKAAQPLADPGLAARSYVNPTPAGELKAMDEAMAPAYLPHVVEASWNEWWEASGYYTANSDADDKRPKFSICLPPPNVTGSLHLGHALTAAVQDLLCRFHRMRGYNVLWIPGIDHAGIATQVGGSHPHPRERSPTLVKSSP